MNWQFLQTILETIWAALNSPVGIAAVAGVVLWILNKLYAKKPDWKKYEGSIIAAVKLAEKSIPDDTPNKAAARLDAALRYVLKIHHEVENRIATAQEVATIREGIQIVHAELESSGLLQKNLTKAVKAALILLMVGVLAVGGCGAPMGKDISSGTAGGNSIKLDQSHGNVIVLTDGALNPEAIVGAAGNLNPTTQPVQAMSDQRDGDAPAE